MTLAEAVKRAPVSLDPIPDRSHFLFEDVEWEFYEATLAQLERSGQHARVTYVDGRMEIMTKTGWHEVLKTALARVLEHYSVAVDVPLQGLGEATLKRKDRKAGVEADESYYITNKPVYDAKGWVDLKNGPPPDLAIEVELSQTMLDKQSVYVRMRVPEIWRASLEGIQVIRLDRDEYRAVEASVHFPELNRIEFFRFVKLAMENQHQAVKELDAWLRAGGVKK